MLSIRGLVARFELRRGVYPFVFVEVHGVNAVVTVGVPKAMVGVGCRLPLWVAAWLIGDLRRFGGATPLFRVRVMEGEIDMTLGGCFTGGDPRVWSITADDVLGEPKIDSEVMAEEKIAVRVEGRTYLWRARKLKVVRRRARVPFGRTVEVYAAAPEEDQVVPMPVGVFRAWRGFARDFGHVAELVSEAAQQRHEALLNQFKSIVS